MRPLYPAHARTRSGAARPDLPSEGRGSSGGERKERRDESESKSRLGRSARLTLTALEREALFNAKTMLASFEWWVVCGVLSTKSRESASEYAFLGVCAWALYSQQRLAASVTR